MGELTPWRRNYVEKRRQRAAEAVAWASEARISNLEQAVNEAHYRIDNKAELTHSITAHIDDLSRTAAFGTLSLVDLMSRLSEAYRISVPELNLVVAQNVELKRQVMQAFGQDACRIMRIMT